MIKDYTPPVMLAFIWAIFVYFVVSLTLEKSFFCFFAFNGAHAVAATLPHYWNQLKNQYQRLRSWISSRHTTED